MINPKIQIQRENDNFVLEIGINISIMSLIFSFGYPKKFKIVNKIKGININCE